LFSNRERNVVRREFGINCLVVNIGKIGFFGS
jgi:hypothetical protein